MVILKQKTWKDKAGKAVAHEHPDAAYLIGPQGAKISDESALALGLEDGALPKTGTFTPGPKELTGTRKMLHEVDVEQKKAATESVDETAARHDDEAATRQDQIKAEMRNMVKDDGAMTAAGLPDARTLSSRLGFSVKTPERDEVWAEVEEELTSPE